MRQGSAFICLIWGVRGDGVCCLRGEMGFFAKWVRFGKLTIYALAVTNIDDQDRDPFIIDGINDPISAYPKPPGIPAR